MLLLRSLWEFFCAFVGVVSGVASIILIFVEDKNIKYTTVLVALCVTSLTALSYLTLRTHHLKSKLSCLKLLSKDGHIHTARMVVLRENFNSLTDIDIKKQNLACAKKAEFSWLIEESKNGESNVIYLHKFDFVKKRAIFSPSKLRFVPWFFGENDNPPLECKYNINNTGYKNVNASPVITDGSRDYAANEGIYKMTVPICKLFRKKGQQIEISYSRKNAFLWNRDEIFVIWPKCFFSTAKKNAGEFIVKFKGSHTNFCITADTYDCKKTFKRDETAITFVIDDELSNDEETVYTATEIDFNPNFIYVIYIKEYQR